MLVASSDGLSRSTAKRAACSRVARSGVFRTARAARLRGGCEVAALATVGSMTSLTCSGVFRRWAPNTNSAQASPLAAMLPKAATTRSMTQAGAFRRSASALGERGDKWPRRLLPLPLGTYRAVGGSA